MIAEKEKLNRMSRLSFFVIMTIIFSVQAFVTIGYDSLFPIIGSFLDFISAISGILFYIVFVVWHDKGEKKNKKKLTFTYTLLMLILISSFIINVWHEEASQYASGYGLKAWMIWLGFAVLCSIGIAIDLYVHRNPKDVKNTAS